MRKEFQCHDEIMERRKLVTWWCHQMETFSALLALCAGNSPVTGEFPAQGQWRGALMFSLICAWISGWVNNGEAGDLRRHRAHYDVIVSHAVCPIQHASCCALDKDALYKVKTAIWLSTVMLSVYCRFMLMYLPTYSGFLYWHWGNRTCDNRIPWLPRCQWSNPKGHR